MTATADASAPALTSSTCAINAGLWLHFRRLPTAAERAELLARARAEPTPPSRRKAFVIGCLCTPDGNPMSLSETEASKLDSLDPKEWDDTITKCAHLNGFAVLQVIAD
jgi:hypothetical protein